ncbi:hypothetical protein BDF14DRAFT_1762991 [Spinellus fusiger]|nr:hypothetical protein BDF14DRAFT_1762991 [Spinellus fusiger]
MEACFFFSGPIHAFENNTIRQFSLFKKTKMSPDTYLYRFALPNKWGISGIPVGQHIQVVAVINGKEIQRSYTPMSAADARGYFEILVKTYPDGAVSQYLASLSVGDIVTMKGPKGSFQYTPNMVRAIGIVAGGSGITPIFQTIKTILENPKDKTEVTLIYGNCTEQDILLRTELDSLSVLYPDKFNVHYVLSRADASWTGPTGYITQDKIAMWLPAPAGDVKILVCGPPAQVKSVIEATTTLGFTAPRTVSKITDQIFKF